MLDGWNWVCIKARCLAKNVLISCLLCSVVQLMLSFYKVLSDCFLQGDGKIVLEDDTAPSTNGVHSVENGLPSKRPRTTAHPVDLELEVVLGKMPQKVSCISIYS